MDFLKIRIGVWVSDLAIGLMFTPTCFCSHQSCVFGVNIIHSFEHSSSHGHDKRCNSLES